MHFNAYLKNCRTRYNLTQEQLVEELYGYDDAFKGLDTRTLSRWEAARTKPPLAKQLLIVKFFRRYSSHLFPCFYDIENIEEKLCRDGLYNLLGNPKEHIFKFPQNAFRVDEITITHLRSLDEMERQLEVSHSIIDSITQNYYQLSPNHLKQWALHPSNLFIVAQNNHQTIGMLNLLKLKPTSFEQILSFEKTLRDLKEEEFAKPGEECSLFFLTSYAFNETVATLMLVRYYAHLIANQNSIIEVGSTVVLESGKKFAERMHLKHIRDKEIEDKIISAYSAPLEDVLVNSEVLKMIFHKEECPEESA